MQKALRVLIIIAVVLALIQILDLVVVLVEPKDADSASWSSGLATSALIRWLVYWLGGLITLTIGLVVRRKVVTLGAALAIGGAYLMLLGNNGGLWSIGHEGWRLLTSMLTLVILAALAIRLDQPKATPPSVQVSAARVPQYDSQNASI